MSARVIATDGKFRIVRQEDGNAIRHVLEKRDDADAMGVERWKDCNVGTGDSLSKQLRDWIIEHATKCSQMKQE